MENFNEILNYIGRTNLFNFVIFLSIIIFLIKKIDVCGKIEQARQTVDDTIKESENAKTESETKLSSIEDSMSHIEEEIDEILKKSETNAKLIGEKILEDGEKTALLIKENTNKAIDNSLVILKNELLKRASLASIEVAKSHIINELNQNQDLHNKLIDESVEAIEGVEV